MKKIRSVICVILMIVSCVFAKEEMFYAQEMTMMPYVLVCPSCGERLVHKVYRYDIEKYVSSCKNYTIRHRHVDHVVEKGYYLNKTETVTSTTCTLQ